MALIQQQPVLAKSDHAIIMQYLRSGETRTLFNRMDADEMVAEIKRAAVIDDDALPADVVRLNSKVKIKDEKESKLIELTVVTPKLANIKERKVSVMSPIGIAIIGCREGQRIAWRGPGGDKRLTIVEVGNS